ncbi:hypothetical protein KIN20_007569 [Parelaphostrongylus tenuis]|uniref:Uncharacterized protein n=1 Tax=Parelaphostrongylus tenuis TaxID=148309 RepID=A0AAD5QM47_PARTN|nr:hypothetical protein KIN20_007569 [Parelaphostrongylus tenuis]
MPSSQHSPTVTLGTLQPDLSQLLKDLHMNRADTKKMDCTLLKLTSTTLRNEGIVMVHVVSCVVLNTVAMTNLLETSWSNSRVDKSRCRFET